VRGDFTDLLDRAGFHIQISRGDEARDDDCQTRVFLFVQLIICTTEVRQPPPSAASMKMTGRDRLIDPSARP